MGSGIPYVALTLDESCAHSRGLSMPAARSHVRFWHQAVDSINTRVAADGICQPERRCPGKGAKDSNEV
jgi:hypothetical protein